LKRHHLETPKIGYASIAMTAQDIRLETDVMGQQIFWCVARPRCRPNSHAYTVTHSVVNIVNYVTTKS